MVVKPDYESTFPIEDKSGLVRLRKQFGSGCQVRIKILAEAARELALSEAPDDAEGILLALERQSPLKLADMVWSSPVSDGATTRLSLVRKAWFRQQLASVRRNLSPSSLIIMDEAGRLFDDTSKRSLLVPAGTALIGTLILVAAMLAFGGRHDPRLVGTDPIGYPSGLPASKASIPPQLERAPAEPSVANAGTSPANFELVGVVGRLPRDAVALVRPPWGKVVTLRIGDSLLGWRLTALSADRVTLTKGTTSRDITLKPVAAPER